MIFNEFLLDLLTSILSQNFDHATDNFCNKDSLNYYVFFE